MQKNRLGMNINCNACPVSFHCLTHTLNKEQREKLNAAVTYARILTAGEHLYFQQEKMEYVFAIYSGSCKEYILGEDGDEKINNFYYPGDLLALESLTLQKYEFSLMTLEKSQFCAIPVKLLFSLMEQFPVLLQRFINLLSGKLQKKSNIPLTTKANRRVAAFLMELFYSNQQPSFSGRDIHLPMSQFDIGNRLGLAHETISRTFRLLQDGNIIKLENKKFSISDIDSLKKMAGLPSTC